MVGTVPRTDSAISLSRFRSGFACFLCVVCGHRRDAPRWWVLELCVNHHWWVRIRLHCRAYCQKYHCILEKDRRTCAPNHRDTSNVTRLIQPTQKAAQLISNVISYEKPNY
ncbi:hypothetical protein DESC_890002 [Desulfosarcina cetonica]|nr:hypothetical protein DESC_890002 [Desulfosarcina cetonica]